MVEDVAFLVADAALHGRLAEDGADRLPERLGAVDHEQHPLLGVEAARDEIREQRGRDRRVLLTRDRSLMGKYATGRAWTVVIVAVTLMIAAATVVLGVVLLGG